MPWPLVHLERALYACAHIPAAFKAFATCSKDLTNWFVHYAGLSGGINESKVNSLTASVSASVSPSMSGMKTSAKNGPAHVAVSLFDPAPLVVTKNANKNGSDTLVWSIHESSVVGMTYKALSQFAHDFGIVPYLLKEPQLFG